MEHKGTVRIETPRLVLRRYKADDAEAMFRNWACDDEVTKFLTWPTHRSIDDSKRIINEWIPKYTGDDYYLWGITVKDNGDEVIGTISGVDIDDKIGKAHIGYCIGRKWWHQGITSEALSALISFFFLEVKANRIEARHDPRYVNSGRVMQKCGLKYEGTLRANDLNNQGICDEAVYGLLRSEWQESGK